ncbi:MAG: primosomal protein N' [Oscillospiraceae bacterium]|nr:primosomal protein N' [Oscillospiraceae bacterium]
MIAKVIVDYRSKHIDRVFDYLVPTELEDKLETGSRVLVPFSAGNREVEGFCMGFAEKSKSKKIKSIIRIANDTAGFDADMLPLIEWMHKKYLAPYLDIIHTIVPSGTAVKSKEWIILLQSCEEKSEIRAKITRILSENGGEMEYGALKDLCGEDIRAQVSAMIKKGELKKEYRQSVDIKDKQIRCIRLTVNSEEAHKEAERIGKKAPVQARMLEFLSSNEYVSVADLKRFTDGSYNAVSAIVRKGLAKYIDVTVDRNPYKNRQFKKTEKMTPTLEQENAITRITDSVKTGESETYLLHGVTGSGKTEVFMQAIEYAVSIGKSAIMLVPEISLTPQMVARFMSRFGDRVAIFHSGLSLGERYDQWKRIKDGGADIVIGARSAVFTPLKNIGIIIMDEEHSDTYKSDMSPRYHAGDVAIFRAKQSGAAVVLASATPSVESYYKAKTGEYTLIEMKSRYNSNKMPDISVVDMRGELARGNKSMLSGTLYRELSKNLQCGEQTILFLNRRGFSTFVSCRACGYVPQCPNCNISLTYHKSENSLKCHYCGFTRPNYTLCPECGSKYIRYFGAGTQKVEDEIKRLFPNASTIRMDMDTTGKKQSHEKILTKFEKDKIDILIGTQMVTKGLDFENVTLVGVITADTMLNINDFRSGERTFAMLEQVSGRAGRGSREGRAVIQTYTPEHEAVSLVKSHDYISFYNSEIEERRLMWYPPFCSIISVLFQGPSETLVPQTAKYFVKQIGDLKALSQKIQVLGPIPSYISKIKNKYRWQIIFKCEDDDKLGEVLKNAETQCRANKIYEGVSIVIDKSPGMIY